MARRNAPRVLILGGRRCDQALGSVARGFQYVGCDVLYLATRRPGARGSQPIENITDTLIEKVCAFKPAVLFWMMCKQDCPPGLITRLRGVLKNMACVFHSFDDPHVIDADPHPCIGEFTHAVTCCEGSVPWYRDRHVEPLVFYPPVDPFLHGEARARPELAVDFSFAATNVYPPKEFPQTLIGRTELVRAAAKMGSLVLYGYFGEKSRDWGSIHGVPELAKAFKGYVRYEDSPNIFASTAINLCTHVRPDGYRYLNERVLTVMASGGFLMSDAVNGMGELFHVEHSADQELETFRTLDEFTAKARRWLRDPNGRAAVARAGRRAVLSKWTNVHHALAVLQLCGVKQPVSDCASIFASQASRAG